MSTESSPPAPDGLGALLRQARERSGLDLSSIAERTHVRRAYLQALEDEDLSALPEDVYARNFVRLYARTVDLDPEEAVAAFAALRYDAERWDAGFQAAWHGFDHSLFRDGVDFGPFANWRPNEDWRIGAALSYDTGPDGWYGRFEAEWSQPTGRDSFLSLLAGASGASGYYGRNGANDLYARASWTYAFNRSVAVTPFLGSSFALDSAGSDRLFGGLWFEVNF